MQRGFLYGLFIQRAMSRRYPIAPCLTDCAYRLASPKRDRQKLHYLLDVKENKREERGREHSQCLFPLLPSPDGGARKGASHSLPLPSRVFPSDFGGSCRASPAVTAVTGGRMDDDDTSENVTSTSEVTAEEVTCRVVRSPRCYSMMCNSGFPVLRPSPDLICRSGGLRRCAVGFVSILLCPSKNETGQRNLAIMASNPRVFPSGKMSAFSRT